MKFRGNASQLKTFFDTLIAIFGEDAKIITVESRTKSMKAAQKWGFITD